jgi:hypothetical protein
MSIVITPNVSLTAAHGAAAPVVLQSGSVISARVQQVLTSDTVRIAIAGQSINVQSQVPLQAGQTLQLAVSQTADGTIRLAVVNQQPASQAPGAAANPTVTTDTVALAPDSTAIAAQPAPAAVASNIQLTPRQAVTAAVQTAVSQQNGLAPLFANLSVAALIDSLPPQVQQAVAQVLAQQTNLDQNLTGADIKQAFQSSGLFLEASLATGSVSSAAATPDLKAALIVLRQVLTTSLNSVTATSTTPAPAAAVPLAATPAATTVTPQPTVPLAATTLVTAAPNAAATSAAAVIQQAPAAAVAAVLVAQPAVGTTTAAVVEQATAAVAAVVQQDVQSAVAVPQQSVTTTVVGQMPTTASPTLAPQLASEVAALTASAAPVAPDALNLAVANAVILPPSTPATAANAAALTVASSAALNLLQEAVQTTPLLLVNPAGLLSENNQMLALVPAVGGLARPSMVDEAEFAHTNMPPPPLPGAVPAAQPVLPATLLSNSPAESAMHRLLADTDAAIARQTLLQVASLPDRVDSSALRPDQQGPRWNFEIPFATPHGTAMAQFEISRDGGGDQVEAAKRVWRARFSLDVEPSGPIHALVSLSGERTSVRMWAERPATAAQLRAGAAQLSQALRKAELTPGDIVIRDGNPPQSAPARAGHFLDRAL